MRFLTAYSPKPKASSPVGNREYVEAHVKFSPDGNLSLEYGKPRDRQTEINSYKESCIVSNLVKRYENGDQLALLRGNPGCFADLSQMPANIHEAQKLSRNVETLYNSLGDDVRANYATLAEFTEAFSTVDKFKDFVKTARTVVNKRAAAAKAAAPVKEVKTDA